jgi:hypothetical protein
VANYFLSPPASLPWQWNYCVRENNSSESNELEQNLLRFIRWFLFSLQFHI